MTNLKDDGYIIIPNFLPNDMVEKLYGYLWSANEICKIAQRKNGIENSDDTVHHLPCIHSVWHDVLKKFESIDLVLKNYFEGAYILNSFGGNLLRSGSYASNIHRDIRTFSGDIPLLLNTIIALDDFTENNGATWLLRGSHKAKEKPTEKLFWEDAKQITMNAGDILLFNSNVWHAAGVNTTDKRRRSVTPMFCKPFMKPQFDYMQLVSDDMSDYLKQVLGYNSRIPKTLNEWYQPEETRFYKKDQG